MPPTTTTTTAPPALPDLAGYEPYGKALARDQELNHELTQARADLKAAKAELDRVRPPKGLNPLKSDPVPVDPVAVTAHAIANGADVDAAVAADKELVRVAQQRVDDLQFKVYALEDALELFRKTTLSKERGHAQRHFAPGVYDRVYLPAMKAAAKVWAAAAVELHRMDQLRAEVERLGLWTEPMATTAQTPVSPWGDPGNTASDAAWRIGQLIADGFLDAADPVLTGVYPPRDPFAGCSVVPPSSPGECQAAWEAKRAGDAATPAVANRKARP